MRHWTSLASLLLFALLPGNPLAGASPDQVGRPTPELSEAARWLQEYLRIDTTNPPGNEHRGAAFLRRILQREAIPHRLLVTPEGRTSLYARLEATDPDPAQGALLLMHHIDVVPAEGDWQHPPFSGAVADGYLWGRGAVDTKSLGIAHLAALVSLKRNQAPRSRDIVFLAVADEENGGGRGTAWLLKEHGELFADVTTVLNEGGGNRTVNGRTVWWGVEVAQKRPLWLRLTARGRGGHGSGFNPGSSGHQLILALERLLRLELPYRITPAVQQYLEAIAPLHNEHMATAFLNLEQHVTESSLSQVFAPGMAGLFVDTLQVTRLAGSARINSIAEKATAEVDIRLLPETDDEAFLQRIREALGRQIQVEVLLRFPSTPASPAPANGEPGSAFPVLKEVLESEGQGPVVPIFIAGFTDSRFFRHRGVSAYGLSPFTLEPQDLLGIHGKDERIDLKQFANGIGRMERIVSALGTKVTASP